MSDDYEYVTGEMAWTKAEEIQATLTDKDFDYNNSVIVSHWSFKGEFRDAFALSYKDWYLIFSRYQKHPHVFHCSNIDIREVKLSKHWADILTLTDFEKNKNAI